MRSRGRLPGVFGALVVGVSLVLVGACSKSPTPGGTTTTAGREALPFKGSPAAEDVGERAGLAFPESVTDYRSVRVSDSELDLIFRIAPDDVAAFAEDSGLAPLQAGRLIIVHPSPIWDLDPGGDVESGQSVHDGLVRQVEVVTVPGEDLRSVRVVIATDS